MPEEANLTIPGLLARTVEQHHDEPALGSIRDGQLHWRTWREVWDDAQTVAATLRVGGLQPGDRVAQVSENRPEWIITDLALHLAGAVHVPIHVTLSGPQIADQIADFGARLVFVSSEALLAKFADLLDDQLRIVVHDAVAKPPAELASLSAPSPQSLAPNDLATILYTSGTTGRPRGVMLSQGNLSANAAALVEAHAGCSDETRLCILPLSHIYARTCDLYTWVYRGSQLVLAEGRDTLPRDCQLARPTSLSAVPYVYQQIADRVRAASVEDESAVLQGLFGGQMRRLSCGGAALAPDIEAWYADRGMPILCGYGLSEASPVVTTSTLAAHRLHCVGQPLPGVELRMADDGEVLVRSPGVMLGYWQDPAATAEAIRDGWLHTGDLGQLDADGYLEISGRKKELIVLSNGKNISPARVENLLTGSPHIEQAAVFGDGQTALVALIVPATAGLPQEDYAREIDARLASCAREEQIGQFAILDRPFSSELGELTSKMSLCRDQIAHNFADQLAALGAAGSRPIARRPAASGDAEPRQMAVESP
jgi:long-chain acyl-CoA synthetase